MQKNEDIWPDILLAQFLFLCLFLSLSLSLFLLLFFHTSFLSLVSESASGFPGSWAFFCWTKKTNSVRSASLGPTSSFSFLFLFLFWFVGFLCFFSCSLPFCLSFLCLLLIFLVLWLCFGPPHLALNPPSFLWASVAFFCCLLCFTSFVFFLLVFLLLFFGVLVTFISCDFVKFGYSPTKNISDKHGESRSSKWTQIPDTSYFLICSFFVSLSLSLSGSFLSFFLAVSHFCVCFWFSLIFDFSCFFFAAALLLGHLPYHRCNSRDHGHSLDSDHDMCKQRWHADYSSSAGFVPLASEF